MLFVVRFTDKPGTLPLRQQFLPAHVEWLDAQKATILVAGSVRHEPDAAPVGGVWIVEADSKDAIEALLKFDPFWRNGIRQTYEILHWNKAFPDRKVPV
jgi:uncharacterized protein YciI